MSLWNTHVYSHDFNNTTLRSAGDLLTFASPDYLYNKDDSKNALDFLKSNLELHIDNTLFVPFKIFDLNVNGGHMFLVGDKNDHNYMFSSTDHSVFQNEYFPAIGATMYDGSDAYDPHDFATFDSDYRINNSYIYPVRILNNSTFGNNSFSISSIKYIESPDPFSFENNG